MKAVVGAGRPEVMHSAAQFDRRLLRSRSALIAQEHIPGERIELGLLAVRGQVQAWATLGRTKSGPVFIDQPELRDMARTLVGGAAYHGFLCIDAVVDGRGGIVLAGARPHCWSWMNCAARAGLNFLAEALPQARRNDPASMVVGLEAGALRELGRREGGASWRKPHLAAYDR